MYIQWSTIPNLIIEVAGIMSCIFALILIKKGMNNYERSRKFMTYAFSMMLVYNLCLLLLEFTQFDPVPSPRALVFLLDFGTYVFPELAAYYISLYIICIISKSEEDYQKGLFGLSIFLIAEFILLLIVQFTGNLVYVDQAGRYSTGPAGFLGYAFVMIYMAMDLFLLLKYGSGISRRQKNAVMFYLFLPIFSLIFKCIWPAIYFTALASCISMMIMLISIVNEQSAALIRQSPAAHDRKQVYNVRLTCLILAQITTDQDPDHTAEAVAEEVVQLEKSDSKYILADLDETGY